MIAPRYHSHFFKSGYADSLSTEVMEVMVQWFDEGNLLIDLGCGSGWDTLELAEHGFRVLALDSHATMIDQLTYKVANRGIQDNVCSFIFDPDNPRPYHRLRLDMKIEQPYWQDSIDAIYAGMGVIQTVRSMTTLGQWLHRAMSPGGLAALVLLNPNSYSIFTRQIKSRRQVGPWTRRRGEAGLNSTHSRSVKWMGGATQVISVWNRWFELVDIKPLGEGLPPFETIDSSTRITGRTKQSGVQRVLNRRDPARFADWLFVLLKRRGG